MYRICTEDKNRDRIERIIANHGIDGFAMLPGQGYWKGQRENSLTLEFVGAEHSAVLSIAKAIKVWNSQEAVLVQHVPVEAEFV